MTRRARSLTLISASLLLTGCMVGPKYTVPNVAVAPAFKEAGPIPYKETAADGTAWQTVKPEDAIPRGNWWTIFNDAQLNSLEPRVEQANQTLKQADANLRAARAEITVRKADRWPTIGVNTNIPSQRYSDAPYFNPVPAFGPSSTTTQYPFEVNYEVDLWGQIRHNIAAGKEELQATAADRANVLLSLQAELAFDYFNLRSDDRLQQLLNDTVVQYKEAVRITTNRYNGGLAVKSDVTQAETQLQTAIVAASDVAVERSQFEHAIANLIGVTPASLTIPFSPLPENTEPPVVPPGLPSELLQRRPDVAAAERRANEGNEAIGIAQSAFYPSLNLSGAIGYQSNAAVQSIFSPASVVYSLGPGIAYTFFDAGRRRGIKEESLALFDRDSAAYKQSVLDAVQQVEDNLVSLRVLQEEATQQRTGTAAAQESERIFNNRYVGGVDTYLQVVTAQTAALDSEVNDINILRRRMDSTVLLVKTLGGGWDRSQLPTP
jgi:NodT family efflux transporter outer membrane factor (OMF) lipoprotein